MGGDKKGEDGRVGGVIRRERMGGWEVIRRERMGGWEV